MQDKRTALIDAAFAVLAEEGYPGLTQPRVAARAGVRQSHLTYYFPTRLALLEAITREAVERQMASVDANMATPDAGSPAERIGKTILRRESTRVLIALVQGADREPTLRPLFAELVDGMLERAGKILAAAPEAPERSARLLHALSVGLAVLALATDRPAERAEAVAVLDLALDLIRNASGAAPVKPAASTKGNGA